MLPEFVFFLSELYIPLFWLFLGCISCDSSWQPQASINFAEGCLRRIVLSVTLILFVPASGRSCPHCWDGYYIQGVDHVVDWHLTPMSPQNCMYGAWRGDYCWKKKSGWGHWRMAVWRQAETTDNLYAHKDPILFGEVILLAFLWCADSLIHVWLFVTPQTGPWQAPVSMGILQKRILEWVAMPSSRGSSWPRNWTRVFCITCRFFTSWATRKTQLPPYLASIMTFPLAIKVSSMAPVLA